jgi:hypothetical protein
MFYNGSWSGYVGWVQSNQIAVVSRIPKPTHSVVVQYTHVFPDTADFPVTGWLPGQLLTDVSFGTWLEVKRDVLAIRASAIFCVGRREPKSVFPWKARVSGRSST